MARSKNPRDGSRSGGADDHATGQGRFTLLRWLRNSFFTGVVIATPVIVTGALVYTFVTFVDNRLKPLIPPIYNPETYLRRLLPEQIEPDFAIPGLGVVFAVIVLTMLGALARNIIGRSLLGWGERLVSGFPIVRNIYGALKQLVETIATRPETTFKEVVIIEYPRPGLFAVGFITAAAKGEVAGALSEEFVGVFVPTAPNPTSGFLLYVRRSELKVLDMSIEEGAKLIISAGIVTPEGAAAPTESPGAQPGDGAVAVE